MRRAEKRDSNEPDIVKALEGIGASVERLSGKKGLPDLLVGMQGRNLLLEVKDATTNRSKTNVNQGRGGLDDDQVIWHSRWRGQVAVVRSVDEAIKAVLERK